MDSRAEFDAKDMELMEQARRETEAAEAAASTDEVDAAVKEAAAPAVAAPAPETAATAPATAPAVAQAPGAAPAAAATPAAPAADAQGSAKAALRASRHQEKLLRDENAALRKRIEEGGHATPTDDDKPDETQLNDVREYAPKVGKRLDALERENVELRARVTTAAPAPAFQPVEYSPDVQAAIDEVPELLLWHSSEDKQQLFELAIADDRKLALLPQWQGKPLAARFAQAVVNVNKDMGAAPSTASTAKTLEDAQRVIAAATSAPTGQALTVGDLRGGATPASNSNPDYHAMKKAGMSDEDMIASLPELP